MRENVDERPGQLERLGLIATAGLPSMRSWTRCGDSCTWLGDVGTFSCTVGMTANSAWTAVLAWYLEYALVRNGTAEAYQARLASLAASSRGGPPVPVPLPPLRRAAGGPWR